MRARGSLGRGCRGEGAPRHGQRRVRGDRPRPPHQGRPDRTRDVGPLMAKRAGRNWVVAA